MARFARANGRLSFAAVTGRAGISIARDSCASIDRTSREVERRLYMLAGVMFATVRSMCDTMRQWISLGSPRNETNYDTTLLRCRLRLTIEVPVIEQPRL